MATKDEINKLADSVGYYIKYVIRFDCSLKDCSQPGLNRSPKLVMFLPISQLTLYGFLGPEFVDSAPRELLFAILIGLAYHEAAHQLSGEIDIKPDTLNNIICDSNDFNVSIYFVLTPIERSDRVGSRYS